MGQLELREKLRLPEMRQVAQRVSVRCNLDPLDRDGVSGYISHRLQVAGGSPDRVRFSHEVIDAVYETTGGVPRLINRLCDRALHNGHLRRVAVIDAATFALAHAEVEPLLPADVQKAAPSVSVPGEPGGVARRAADGSVDRAHASWFDEFDAHVANAEPPVAPFGTAEEPVATSRPDDHATRTVVPLTHMEMLQRRWLRRLKIALLFVALLGAGGYGFTIVLNSLEQPVFSPEATSPEPPDLPMPLVIPSVPDDYATPAVEDDAPFPY